MINKHTEWIIYYEILGLCINMQKAFINLFWQHICFTEWVIFYNCLAGLKKNGCFNCLEHCLSQLISALYLFLCGPWLSLPQEADIIHKENQWQSKFRQYSTLDIKLLTSLNITVLVIQALYFCLTQKYKSYKRENSAEPKLLPFDWIKFA